MLLINNRIRAIRKEAHFTQQQFAEIIDIETNSLQAIEKGRRTPNCSTILKMIVNAGINPNLIFQDYIEGGIDEGKYQFDYDEKFIRESLKFLAPEDKKAILRIIKSLLVTKNINEV